MLKINFYFICVFIFFSQSLFSLVNFDRNKPFYVSKKIIDTLELSASYKKPFYAQNQSAEWDSLIHFLAKIQEHDDIYFNIKGLYELPFEVDHYFKLIDYSEQDGYIYGKITLAYSKSSYYFPQNQKFSFYLENYTIGARLKGALEKGQELEKIFVKPELVNLSYYRDIFYYRDLNQKFYRLRKYLDSSDILYEKYLKPMFAVENNDRVKVYINNKEQEVLALNSAHIGQNVRILLESESLILDAVVSDRKRVLLK